MKTKSTASSKTDQSYPHVSQTSTKISKIPCSMIRITNDQGILAISSQISQNGYGGIAEESSKDQDTGQTCLSFNGCTDAIEERLLDPFRPTLSSGAETMLADYNSPSYGHCHQFDAGNGNNFTNFQMPPALEPHTYEVCPNGTGFPIEGIRAFDESCYYYNTPSDLQFTGTNSINHVAEGVALFPTDGARIEALDYQYGGACQEFQQMSDSSWFQLMCHQAMPFTEELDINLSQFDSDIVDYFDPESFVRSFLDISDDSNTLPALVSKETGKRKDITLVLDLDETLIHSTMEQCEGADFTFTIFLDKDKKCPVSVRKRPFLRQFLEKVSEMFEIIIFTASKRLYAEKLLDILDPDNKFFSRRVYRDSCIMKDGTYTKDLTVLGLDLAKVVIVDNSPKVFRLQVNNGIPIKSWYDDPSDSALISLLPFLEKLVDVDDVRPIIAEKFGASN